MSSTQKFDYITSPPDARDYTFSAPPSASSLNDNVSASVYTLPVNRLENQGSVGACTAFGITSAFERLVTVMTGDTSFQGSPMFNYTNSRILDADELTEDNGTTLRSACANLRLSGICRDTTWPYTVANFYVTPSQQAYAEARELAQVINYYEVNRTLASLKYIIGTFGYYVSIGFVVYPGFETATSYQSGDVPDPDINDQPIGGHCINLIGWDDNKQRFTFINQYGPSYGRSGLGTISYDYVLNKDLTPEIKVLLPDQHFISAYTRFAEKNRHHEWLLNIIVIVCVIILIILIVLFVSIFVKAHKSRRGEN